MASGSSVDTSEWTAGLNKLTDPALRASLARSMAVAGGKVFRDEAKLQAPVESGLLRSSIYLAFQDTRSSEAQVIYSVSWNAKTAPHGHLLEFGHWRYNKFVNGFPQHSLRAGLKKGKGPQDHVGRGALDMPRWVAARPFLRPAQDAAGQRAVQAMVDRGRERLPELLAGVTSEVTE